MCTCLLLISIVADAQDVGVEEVVELESGDVVVVTDDGKVNIVPPADDAADDAAGEDADAVQKEIAAVVVEEDPVEVVFVEAVAGVDAAVAEVELDGEVEFQADGKNVIGQAIGGFIRAFGAPLRAPAALMGAPNDAFNKDVDKIKSEVELRKLEQILRRDQQVKQIHPRVKKLIESARSVELEFLHLACNLRRSEFKEIEKQAQAASLRVLIKQCQAYGRQFRGRNRGLNQTGKLAMPQTDIADGILKSATTVLGEKRAGTYKKELEKRDQFRKEAVIGTLTSGFDSMVHFDEEQRAKVKQVLSDQWQDSWNMQFQYFGNIEYIAGIPHSELKKVMTKEQRVIFDSLNWQPQGVQQFFWNNQIDMFGFAQRNRSRLETRLKFAPEEK